MEQLNSEQPIQHINTLSSSEQTIPLQSKNNLLMIIGALVLLILVAVVSYYFGTQKFVSTVLPQENIVPQQNSDVVNEVETILPNEEIPENTGISEAEGVRSISFKVESESAMTGDNTYIMDVEHPSSWTSVQSDTTVGCENFVIQKDQIFKLTLSVDCDGYAAEYFNFPADGVIVADKGNSGDDWSISYRVRYFDNISKTYKYVTALAAPGTKLGEDNNQMMDALSVHHEPYQPHMGVTLKADLSYTGPESEKEYYLSQIDNIIADLKIN